MAIRLAGNLMLFIATALFLSTQVPLEAQAQTAPNKVKGELVVRSILTVSHDAYTSFDAYGILSAWKFVNGSTKKFEINWLQPPEFKVAQSQSLIDTIRAYPQEVQDLLFVTFVWNEVKRLNLFEAPSSEIADLEKKFRESKPDYGLPQQAREFLRASRRQNLLKYFEMAVRARTYKQVRGDFTKSSSLLMVSWFWHNPGKNYAH